MANQKQPNVTPDQEAQIGAALENLSVPDLESARRELDAYIAHRKAAAAPKGAQQAPFNFKNFLANFLKVVQVVWPVIGPLIGAAPGGTAPAAQATTKPPAAPKPPSRT